MKEEEFILLLYEYGTKTKRVEVQKNNLSKNQVKEETSPTPKSDNSNTVKEN